MNDQEKLIKRESIRYKILKRFYDGSVDNPRTLLSFQTIMDDISREDILSIEEVDSAYQYLISKKLVESMTFNHSIITQRGIDEIESSIKYPEKPTEHFSAKSIQLIIQKVVMGDQVNNSFGDISNINGQLLIGKFNDVVTNLCESGQKDFAEDLRSLKDAIMSSQSLSDDQKQNHVEVINQLGEEAAKPNPNRVLLKMLKDGLMETLKAVPDIAKAVVAIAPAFQHLG
jgi:hypothetical protein